MLQPLTPKAAMAGSRLLCHMPLNTSATIDVMFAATFIIASEHNIDHALRVLQLAVHPVDKRQLVERCETCLPSPNEQS